MGSCQSSQKDGPSRNASLVTIRRAGKVDAEASEVILALQNKIAFLEHQLTIKHEVMLRSQRKIMVESELGKMQAAEISFDLISKDAQENFRINCLANICANWKLQKMRKDIIGFSQRQKICDMNLSRALDTAYWEKKIKELEERKDELMHEKQVKEYDLDDLGTTQAEF